MYPKTKSKLGKIFTWMLRLIIAFGLLTGCLFLWAYLSTDTSLVARGIMWGDSDTGDLNRFPSREMAVSDDPVIFASAEGSTQAIIGDLPITNDELGVANMPLDEYLEFTNTTAFIIIHDDQLVYEAYFHGTHRQSSLMTFSVTKAFTSTLIGIAIEEGFIRNLDEPITEYIPELLNRNPGFKEITLRHLITMTSGLRWERSESNPFSDDFVTYYSPDLRTVALHSEIVQAPGQRFVYNDYNPLLLGIVLERATGMSVSKYMESRLWQRMGAEGNGFWSLDSEHSGFEKMFAGLNGRAIDLAKLGWLFLNNGRNGDTQVVPASWIEEATSVNTGNDLRYSYKYYWWIDNKNQMYFAEGDKCQFIYVYPKADLVIVRFGIDCGGTGFSDFIPNIAIWIESLLVD